MGALQHRVDQALVLPNDRIQAIRTATLRTGQSLWQVAAISVYNTRTAPPCELGLLPTTPFSHKRCRLGWNCRQVPHNLGWILSEDLLRYPNW